MSLDPSNPPPSPRRWPRAVPAVAAALGLLAIAWWESGTAIAGDDFGYLLWGLVERDRPFAWAWGPDWLSYHRPMNALGWWLSAHSGVQGDLIRYLNAAIWTAACGSILTLRRAWGLAALGATALLTNQVWVDLLTWRSWLTTTGSCALLIVGIVSVERRVQPWLVALVGLGALGFKEMAPLALAAVCVFTPGYRRVGTLVAVAVGLASLSSSYKLDTSYIWENLRFHVITLAVFAPLVPLALARRWPDLPGWALATTLALLAFPPALVALIVCLAVTAALLDRPAWLVAVGLSWLLPQLGAAHARQYMIEGWLVVVVAIILYTRRVRWTAVLAAVALGLPSAIDFERNRVGLRHQFAEQLTFLRGFEPPLAATLYRPDPMWSIDLDALWWVERGASIVDVPPAGASPRQVGPRSGVWADLATDQGSGSR